MSETSEARYVEIPYELRHLGREINGRWDGEREAWEIAPDVDIAGVEAEIAAYIEEHPEAGVARKPRPVEGEGFTLVTIPYVAERVRAFAKEQGAVFNGETKMWLVPDETVGQITSMIAEFKPRWSKR